MDRAAAILVVAAASGLGGACGRMGFDPTGSEAIVDGGGADAEQQDSAVATLCTNWTDFSAPQLVPAIQPEAGSWVGALSPDEDVIFLNFWSAESQNDIWRVDGLLSGSAGDPVLIEELSSDLRDAMVWVAEGERQAIFSRGGLSGTAADMFWANRSSAAAPWVQGDPLSINSEQDDQGGELALDGTLLVFDSTRDGRTGIYEARLTGSEFAAPVLLAEVSDEAAYDRGPTIRNDGLELIFASDRLVEDDYDLWRATRASLDEPFSAPARLVLLSSPFDDIFPTLSDDGATLYYNYDTDLAGGRPTRVWQSTRGCITP